MPNFAAWLGTSIPISQGRAADAWRRIQQKPTSITVLRTSSPEAELILPPQIVRIEYDSAARETGSGSHSEVSGAGVSALRELTIFGLQGHASQPDTDIQRDDLFALNGATYVVVDVMPTLGELQAKARRVT